MTLARRTQALLDLVEGERSTRSETILAEARSRAEVLVAQAHADARARIREACAEERQRAQERIAAARANLATRRRLHEQRRSTALLALGWQRLPPVLRERWRDAAGRRLWVDAVLAEAARVLPRAPWRIVHAPGWTEPEQRSVAAESPAGAASQADAGIEAGLRVEAGGNVVDATLAGLLADRDEIGARLLRQLEALQ
jgi:hypothetical protein